MAFVNCLCRQKLGDVRWGYIKREETSCNNLNWAKTGTVASLLVTLLTTGLGKQSCEFWFLWERGVQT